ncbi:hypothetical protein EBU95_07335 [bacterium]|nr:hypothetical protein [bacterium]
MLSPVSKSIVSSLLVSRKYSGSIALSSTISVLVNSILSPETDFVNNGTSNFIAYISKLEMRDPWAFIFANDCGRLIILTRFPLLLVTATPDTSYNAPDPAYTIPLIPMLPKEIVILTHY